MIMKMTISEAAKYILENNKHPHHGHDPFFTKAATILAKFIEAEFALVNNDETIQKIVHYGRTGYRCKL